MIRRLLLAVALASMPGCGLIQSGMKTAQAHRPGTVTRTFDAPVNLVLKAALAPDGEDFVFEDDVFYDFPVASLKSARGIESPSGPAIDLSNTTFDIEDVRLGSGRTSGKTKDGRIVTLWLLERDHGRRTEASLLIGKQGDTDLSNTFLDRVAARLGQPSPDLARAAMPINPGGPDR